MQNRDRRACTLFGGRLFGRRAGQPPAGVTVEGIGEELEGAAAGVTPEVVFDDVGGPLPVEEVLQRAGACREGHPATVNCSKQPAGEFEVLPWLVDAPALQEPFAL